MRMTESPNFEFIYNFRVEDTTKFVQISIAKFYGNWEISKWKIAFDFSKGK
jgi:hypothetical protein